MRDTCHVRSVIAVHGVGHVPSLGRPIYGVRTNSIMFISYNYLIYLHLHTIYRTYVWAERVMNKSSEADSELLTLFPANFYLFSFLVMKWLTMGWTPGRDYKLSLRHCVQTRCVVPPSLTSLAFRPLCSQEYSGRAWNWPHTSICCRDQE
jgi:hypothetical protein